MDNSPPRLTSTKYIVIAIAVAILVLLSGAAVIIKSRSANSPATGNTTPSTRSGSGEIPKRTIPPREGKAPTAAPGKPTYPFDTAALEKGKKIGSVTIKLADMESRYKLTYPDTPQTRNNVANWKTVAGSLSREAILINEAVRIGIMSAPSKFDPRKAVTARDYFETKGTTYISGETVSVWFYNMTTPAIGVKSAKEKAVAIVSDMRSKILSGSLTMASAGQHIAAMSELASIDPAYQTNAHITFAYLKKDQKKFNDPTLDEAAWKLNQGEVSPILIGRDFDGTNWYEAYAIIIKVNEKKVTEFDSIDDLVKARQGEGLGISL